VNRDGPRSGTCDPMASTALQQSSQNQQQHPHDMQAYAREGRKGNSFPGARVCQGAAAGGFRAYIPQRWSCMGWFSLMYVCDQRGCLGLFQEPYSGLHVLEVSNLGPRQTAATAVPYTVWASSDRCESFGNLRSASPQLSASVPISVTGTSTTKTGLRGQQPCPRGPGSADGTPWPRLRGAGPARRMQC
jgi:hypothetical protein